ncbi:MULTISPECIES: hypothetical protein [unclassified Pseudodesulfovibrio]|uniref:hypothetical protein n=1 Tax=unclassified Pseudodesulfovibrio TaxID=2661612 RepID=UPI000FEBEA4F|nr:MULTISPECIES: hypothetical protein [unclassified Pseudodesulfovibrio]MCJ2166026.1 hypothetical protein [Pseudodesulfovibrio sp. S3-i]RWU02536.1 hypothetical protein DWB63_15655 [Pseudodesulfovibrio sp. S3]
MGSVVALEEFRQSLGRQKAHQSSPERPAIRGSEIWGRNYTEVEAVVFGLLKVRDIVAYHTREQNSAFDQFCMDALNAAYLVQDLGPARLKAAIKPIKEWVLDCMTEDNKRDMSWALVLTDLIEKSPTK